MIRKGDKNKAPLAKNEQACATWLPTTTLGPLDGRYWMDPFAAVQDFDRQKEFVLTAQMPGLERDQIDVEVTQDGIEWSAHREDEKPEGSDEKGYLARERSYQALHRPLMVPEEVDPANVNAELKHGVLTVKVPKAHRSGARKTKVN